MNDQKHGAIGQQRCADTGGSCGAGASLRGGGLPSRPCLARLRLLSTAHPGLVAIRGVPPIPVVHSVLARELVPHALHPWRREAGKGARSAAAGTRSSATPRAAQRRGLPAQQRPAQGPLTCAAVITTCGWMSEPARHGWGWRTEHWQGGASRRQRAPASTHLGCTTGFPALG